MYLGREEGVGVVGWKLQMWGCGEGWWTQDTGQAKRIGEGSNGGGGMWWEVAKVGQEVGDEVVWWLFDKAIFTSGD